jgi:hypothetical protein
MLKQTLQRLLLTALGLGVFVFSTDDALAQDLEARRWSHLPVGLSIVGAGLGDTDGEIFFDPVLQIENGTFDLYSIGSSYVRAIEWLGKSSRLDIKLPYLDGRWEGVVGGEYASIRRHGFGDPRLRFSMLLSGAPPLTGREFAEYRAQHSVNTTIGIAVTMSFPWGEYYADKLINLGSNRYVIRPSVGLLHQHGPWEFEMTTSLSFYEDNDAYYPGNAKLERDPLWFLQLHGTRNLAGGHWITLSSGYGYDGEFFINDASINYEERTGYLSLGWGKALPKQHSIRLAYVKADTQVVLGSATDNFIFSWSRSYGP